MTYRQLIVDLLTDPLFQKHLDDEVNFVTSHLRRDIPIHFSIIEVYQFVDKEKIDDFVLAVGIEEHQDFPDKMYFYCPDDSLKIKERVF